MDPECFSKCPVKVPLRTEEDEPDLCNPIITNMPKYCQKLSPKPIVRHFFKKPPNSNSLNNLLGVVIIALLIKKYFLKYELQ